MLDFDNIRKNTFAIGAFRAEPTRNLLKKDGQTFPLEPKIMDVLCELASFPGDVIARYDLIQRVWKVDYGADESLTRAISVLRKTFRKGDVSEKYIETISKNGYRLIAPVTEWEDDGTRVTAQPQRAAFLPATAVSETKTIQKPAPEKDVVQETPPKETPRKEIVSKHNVPRPMAEAAITRPSAERIDAAPKTKPQPPQTADAKNARKNLLTLVLGTSTFALMALIIIAIPFGKGYFDSHTDAYETEIAELRDLSKVDPGALDAVDPITVREPFRGDVSDLLKNYGASVAVLPFKDMSPDGTKKYFADGMAEEIVLELTGIDGLRIVGRSAAITSMKDGLGPRRIGETLKVSHLIDGSVRTMNDRVRVSVQLIDSASQTQLWGQSYDGALKDGLNLQSRIASDIVGELNILLALNQEKSFEFNLDGFTLSAAAENAPLD